MSVLSGLISLISAGLVSAKSVAQSIIELISSKFMALGDESARERNNFGNYQSEYESLFVEPRVAYVPDNQCVYAIGDIHGRMDLLIKLINRIDADTSELPDGTDITIIFLGDYIDRGMQSKQVVEYLLSGALDRFNTVFLKGNHEEALLRFVDDATYGPTWASYGAVETLYSYGFQAPAQTPSGTTMDGSDFRDAWASLWSKFRSEIPDHHLRFYRQLEAQHVIGDYVFVHAGLKPGVALEDQSVNDMLWIRDEFINDSRQFDKVVVHGHTPADRTFRDNRRIGLDTGAYITGCLSAGRFFGNEVKFIST